MSALPPDYDSDPERWCSWRTSADVHESIARELHGRVLDVGCGDGRLAQALGQPGQWVGVDSSPRQLVSNRYRPVVLADMRHLPFKDGAFDAVTHLWCLYEVDEPIEAIREAARVLRPDGGAYYACTSSRHSDPELAWGGYPATTFDAEEAASVVTEVFTACDCEYWDEAMAVLGTRDAVTAYCRHHRLPLDRASAVAVPLSLTKRGVLIRATRFEP